MNGSRAGSTPAHATNIKINNMKKTAVEWLFTQMGNIAAGFETELNEGQILEKAKEMEAEQSKPSVKLYTEEQLRQAFIQGENGEGCSALWMHIDEFIESLTPYNN
jgi:hypothetical protein